MSGSKFFNKKLKVYKDQDYKRAPMMEKAESQIILHDPTCSGQPVVEYAFLVN